MTAYRTKLDPVSADRAERAAKGIMEETKKKLGMVPNMYKNMANAPELLETYVTGYNGFRQHSRLTPAEQEVVLLSISYENACTYCMAAHSFIADNMSEVPASVTHALREGRPIEDPKLRALSELTRAVVASRGHPSEGKVKAFLDTGYSKTQVMYVLLAVGVKTLSNYANHVFDTPVDEAFRGRAWTPTEG